MPAVTRVARANSILSFIDELLLDLPLNITASERQGLQFLRNFVNRAKCLETLIRISKDLPGDPDSDLFYESALDFGEFLVHVIAVCKSSFPFLILRMGKLTLNHNLSFPVKTTAPRETDEIFPRPDYPKIIVSFS